MTHSPCGIPTNDSDGTGDIDLSKFLLWWDSEGQARTKRPAAIIRAALSGVVTTIAPAAAAGRDARRVLISKAQSEARTQVCQVAGT